MFPIGKSILALSTCIMASCFAFQESDSIQNESDVAPVKSCIDGCGATLTQPPVDCGYNTPVYLNACAWTGGLQLTGSFIYWKASGNYLLSGFLNNSFSPTPTAPENQIFQGKVLDPNFKYKPGYKLGLGYKFKRDSWDFLAEYTAFHQTVNTFEQVPVEGGTIYAAWTTFVNLNLTQEGFRSVSTSWNTKLDILDAELGRNFFCGRYLTYRPSLGLRSLWLNQNYDLNYISLNQGIPVDSFNSSKSWGIGPRLNLDSSWYLGWGLKVVGDIGISLLYVQDYVAAKQTNAQLLQVLPSTDIIYKNKEFIETVKAILDLSLGLAWDKTFCDDKCYLSLFIGYDFSNYWDQGSIQLGTAPLVAPGGPVQFLVGGSNRNSGNLSTQGLRATARFDF